MLRSWIRWYQEACILQQLSSNPENMALYGSMHSIIVIIIENNLMSQAQIVDKSVYGSIHSITAIIVGNELYEPCSNPGQCCTCILRVIINGDELYEPCSTLDKAVYRSMCSVMIINKGNNFTYHAQILKHGSL